MNRKNLKLLADYLLKLPEDYRHFDMEVFTGEAEFDPAKISHNHCSTAACAVGHAVYVDGLPKPLELEDWYSYSGRIFVMDVRSSEWEWCFGGEWCDTDNTPNGAAKRILWLLDHGLPEDWSNQMWGDCELCYKGEQSCT